MRRGSAKSMDHAQLVHEQWLQAAEYGMELFIRRVGTDDNIADLPSREVALWSKLHVCTPFLRFICTGVCPLKI